MIRPCACAARKSSPTCVAPRRSARSSETQLQRLEKLETSNAIAKTQIDEARATLETNVQTLAHARAQMHQIDHDIDQADVRAPFAGIVTERFAQRGEYLQVGASIVHLVDTDHIEARVQAPLAMADKIHAGMQVTVKTGGQETTRERARGGAGRRRTRAPVRTARRRRSRPLRWSAAPSKSRCPRTRQRSADRAARCAGAAPGSDLRDARDPRRTPPSRCSCRPRTRPATKSKCAARSAPAIGSSCAAPSVSRRARTSRLPTTADDSRRNTASIVHSFPRTRTAQAGH